MKKDKQISLLMWSFGMIFVALGVAICSKASLGVSMIAAPAFVISEALYPIWNGFSVGMTEYLIQGVLLIILCIFIKKVKVKYFLAFAVAVLYGYILNFFLWTLSEVSFNTIWLRYLMLIIGDCFTAFGVASFFRTNLPLQVYELFVSETSAHFKFNINKTKWIFDISLLIISLLLAFFLFDDTANFEWSKIGETSFHSIGLGTLITTLINSPLIGFMGKQIDRFLKA